MYKLLSCFSYNKCFYEIFLNEKNKFTVKKVVTNSNKKEINKEDWEIAKKVLDKIAEYCKANDKNLIVYGHYWHNKHWWQESSAKKKFAKKYPNLVGYVRNEFLYGNDVTKLYLQSKICMNIHTVVHKGINPRTFEILGNGNFELCDYRSDAEQFGLIDKENIAMFSDAEDCVKQVDYYLKNEVERKTIGKHGKETVENKYTMTKLLSDVLEEMK